MIRNVVVAWGRVTRPLDARLNGDIVASGYTTAVAVASPHLRTLTTTCPATAILFGAGCASSGGVNQLVADTLPWTGSTFQATATGLPSSAFAVAVSGFSSVAQPLSALLPQGVAGCVLVASPDLLDVVPVANNTAHSQLALPNSTALSGQVVYHQMVPFEVNAAFAILAVTSSNGLQLTIGSY